MGFSILEVIIAILIISIGMIGVLSLVTQNIQVQYINKNNLIASQLAQEGLELVRNVRDENWLAGNNYNLDIAGIVGDRTYAIDYRGRNFINPAVNSVDDAGARLNIKAATQLYSHEAGAATPFYRLITAVDNVEYLEVECKVQWEERGRTHDYTAKTLLYDWK